MTEIPHELILAYTTSNFTVLEPHSFTLRIGQHSAELQSLYVEHGVQCAGYLTAWNPFSKQTSKLDNDKVQRQLLEQLSIEGFSVLKALGIDPSGDWPGQESVMFLGLSRERAKLLGSEFGKNAIVWAGPHAVPQCVQLR